MTSSVWGEGVLPCVIQGCICVEAKEMSLCVCVCLFISGRL